LILQIIIVGKELGLDIEVAFLNSSEKYLVLKSQKGINKLIKLTELTSNQAVVNFQL
jgi:hypothetical protein